MSICKFPGHIRSTKLNLSATVFILGLKAKTLLSESFGGNCARAPRLTAVWNVLEHVPRRYLST